MSLYYIVRQAWKRLHRLPRQSETQWQGEHKWMLCAVGLDVAACGDEVLQAWLGEDADMGSDMVL